MGVSQRTERRWIAGAVILALALRLSYVLWGPQFPIIYDQTTYDMAAKNLLTQHIYSFSIPKGVSYFDPASGQVKKDGNTGLPTPTAFTLPGYPLFLAGIYKVFGMEPTPVNVVRIVQAFLSTLIVLEIIILGSILRQRTVGLLAGYFAAVYPPFIWMSGFLLTECLFSFLLISSLLLFISALKSSSPSGILVTGIVLGVSSLVRAVGISFTLPLILVILFYCGSRYYKKGIKMALLLTVGVILVVSPWLIRNYKVFHEPFGLSAETGHVFLLGTYINYDWKNEEHLWPSGNINGIDVFKNDHKKFSFAVTRIKKIWSDQPQELIKWYLIDKPQLMWLSPYSDGNQWLLSTVHQYLLHRWVLLLALMGVIVGLKYRTVLFPTGLLIFFTLEHIPFMTLNRLAAPIMPLVIFLAAYGCVVIVMTIKQFTYSSGSGERLKVIKGILLGSISGTLLYITLQLRPSSLQGYFSPEIAVLSSLGLACFTIGLVIRVWQLLRPRIGPINFVSLVVMGVLTADYLGVLGPFSVIKAKEVSPRAYLAVADQPLEQVIDLPRWVHSYRRYFLRIRADSASADPKNGIRVYIDDEVIKDIPPGQAVHGWIRIPVSAQTIKGKTHIIVRVELYGETDASSNYVNVYLIEDKRGISSFNGNTNDLSLDAGIQKGSYLIGLELKGRSLLGDVGLWLGSPRNRLGWLQSQHLEFIAPAYDWRSYLADTRDIVERKVSVPEISTTKHKYYVALFASGASRPEQVPATYDVVLFIDGQEVATFQGGLPPTLEWRRVEINPQLLVGKNSVNVQVRVKGAPDANQNYINIYGTSRLSGENSLFNGSNKDLSRDPGRQAGEFLIQIETGM